MVLEVVVVVVVVEVVVVVVRAPDKFNPFRPYLKIIHIIADNFQLKNAKIYNNMSGYAILSMSVCISVSVFCLSLSV